MSQRRPGFHVVPTFSALLFLLFAAIVIALATGRNTGEPLPAPSPTVTPVAAVWNDTQYAILEGLGFTPLTPEMAQLMEEDRVGRLTSLRMDLGRPVTPADMVAASLAPQPWALCLMGYVDDDTLTVQCPDGTVIGS